MAYRRKQPAGRATTYEDRSSGGAVDGYDNPSSVSPSPATYAPTLAAQAIRASAAHRDASSISSAYGYGDPAGVSSSPRRDYAYRSRQSPPHQDSASYEYTSMKSLNESKYGFWGALTRKAKAFMEDDVTTKLYQAHGWDPHQTIVNSTGDQFHHMHRSPETYKKTETTPSKSSDAIASSLNYIGGTIKNAFEEGLTIVENKTADIIQETRKLNIRRNGSDATTENQVAGKLGKQSLPQIQTDYETQLKASRDVANAMAAKAKLLLRELKTFKADLAFAKERCAQLEEENKVLRESHEKGDSPEDDDLIRLQLETLLAEKARLAHENSIYARENRFLREIVEYHQLTMQDVVYVDEGIEEVTEVYSNSIPSLTPSRAATDLSTASPLT